MCEIIYGMCYIVTTVVTHTSSAATHSWPDNLGNGWSESSFFSFLMHTITPTWGLEPSVLMVYPAPSGFYSIFIEFPPLSVNLPTNRIHLFHHWVSWGCNLLIRYQVGGASADHLSRLHSIVCSRVWTCLNSLHTSPRTRAVQLKATWP